MKNKLYVSGWLLKIHPCYDLLTEVVVLGSFYDKHEKFTTLSFKSSAAEFSWKTISVTCPPSPKAPFGLIISFSQFPLTDNARRPTRPLFTFISSNYRAAAVAERLKCGLNPSPFSLITMQAPLIRASPSRFKRESIRFAANDRPLVTARYPRCCLFPLHVLLLHVQTMKREHHRQQQYTSQS